MKNMSDSEYEEEEILVFADFKNQLMGHEISDQMAAIKLIGIETANPIAEINGSVFKGTYDYAMGTNVFFEKEENALSSDPLFEPQSKEKYKFFAKTTKVINFQPIFVEKKEDTDKVAVALTEEQNAPNTNQNIDDSLRTNLTYEEAVKLMPAYEDTQWKDKFTKS